MPDLREHLQSALGSKYTVEREIGGGGMGRVFVVRDESLGRRIVVKVLRPDEIADVSIERFKREIQFAAQLQHANIVPLLMAGEADGVPYYAMPYIEGESLRTRIARGAIPIPEIVGLLKDVARALLYAHERSVVHRDIKPDNVMVSGDAAVVTDFGIAKALLIARSVDENRPQTLTRVGISIGTPAYMAPEQAAGDPAVDHRADIYSFGCLAYELIAGVPPFRRNSPHELFAAHISDTPERLTVRRPDCPPALERLVARCLEKQPDRRPQSAREIIEQLDAVASTSGQRPVFALRHSRATWIVAAAVILLVLVPIVLASRGSPQSDEPQLLTVLPFLAVGGDSAQEYLADGMSEEVATALSKTRGVRVVGRTAANRFRGQRDVDVRAVGEALGVSLVVQGSVRRAEGGLRVSSQLTDARTGEELWADSYQRSASEVLAVRDAITQGIIGALRERHGGSVGAAPSVATRGSNDAEAYDFYLRGKYLLQRRAVPQAAQYFERAIARDGNFARAHAGLSTALALFPYFAATAPAVVEDRLRRAAERALALDSMLAEPHTALGMAYMHRFRWDSSHAEHRRAVTLDPSDHEAHLQYGRMLLYLGEADSALAEFRRAAAIDPFSALYATWAGGTLWLSGNRNEATEHLRRAVELDSLNAVAMQFLTRAALDTGDSTAARHAADRLPRFAPWNGIAAYVYGTLGERRKADSIVRALQGDSSWFSATALAWAALGVGDTALALDHLEAATRAKEYWPAFWPILDPMYDPIRRSERFLALVRAAGLNPAQLSRR